MTVGPPIASPSTLAGEGASARTISSEKIACSMRLAPRPPYSSGQDTPAQPPSFSLRCHWRRNWNPASSSAGGWPGWLAASHSRSSSRKACSEGERVRSTSPARLSGALHQLLERGALARELAPQYALEHRRGQPHRTAGSSVPAEAHQRPGALAVQGDPQVHGQAALHHLQREDPAALEPGHLDHGLQLLAARGPVDLAQAGADAQLALVLAHRGDRVRLPGGELVRVGDVVEDLLRAGVDPGFDREVDHGLVVISDRGRERVPLSKIRSGPLSVSAQGSRDAPRGVGAPSSSW